MAVYKKVPGCETVNISTLEFDTKPTKGSFNPVTSDGIAEAVAEATESIPESASESNPIMTAADTERMILETITPAAKTLRFSFSKLDYSPVVAGVGSSGTWKKVSKYAENNVWDWTASGTTFGESFFGAFASEDNIVSVIAAGDCSSITSMFRAFRNCSSLVKCCLFDTSSVTTFAAAFFNCYKLEEIPQFKTSSVTIAEYAFNQCKSIKAVPLLDTSAMTNVDSMFSGCTNVESGALDLYTQMSTQTTPPGVHVNAFANCGSNTTSGAAELAQIPTSWGGTGT